MIGVMCWAFPLASVEIFNIFIFVVTLSTKLNGWNVFSCCFSRGVLQLSYMSCAYSNDLLRTSKRCYASANLPSKVRKNGELVCVVPSDRVEKSSNPQSTPSPYFLVTVELLFHVDPNNHSKLDVVLLHDKRHSTVREVTSKPRTTDCFND